MSTRELSGTAANVDYLLSTRAVRERCSMVYDLALAGGTAFRIDAAKLPEIADYVAEVTLANYPTLDVPFHSRWKHFQAGGVDRNGRLAELLKPLAAEERAIAKIDLVVASVLLDAGAGDVWRYRESVGTPIGRSEGLAVASWHLFVDGRLSSHAASPLRADAQGLTALSIDAFRAAFQVNAENPLDGLEGRFALLHALGRAVAANPRYFPGETPRIGNLARYLKERFPNMRLRAHDVLRALQDSLGSIWPGRVSVAGVNLGDAWPFAPLGDGRTAIVPFHKLSLWLTYSMVEPLEEFGFTIDGFEDLSGLPEYRNGGLFVDFGALVPRDAADLDRTHAPGSELIVAWRALTIVLLDRLAPLVRERLGVSSERMPLGKVLEGGTWAAGRKIAAERRPGGGAPLRLESDGTVF